MSKKDQDKPSVRLVPRWRYVGWIGTVVLGAWLLMRLEPEEISRPVDEYSYALFNRIFSSVVYEAENTDTIGVVIVDDDALRDMRSSWPVPYGLHARVLDGIFYEQPLAVFLDFTLRDRRGPPGPDVGAENAGNYPQNYVLDQSLNRLMLVLKKYHESGIPVFITAAELKSWEQNEVLEELAAYVTPVAGWGDAKSQSDVRGISYSLYPDKPNQNDSHNADQSYLKSAALTLYEDLCLRKAKLQASEKGSKNVVKNWNCDGVIAYDGKEKLYGITDAWREYSRDRLMSLIWPEKQSAYDGWTSGVLNADLQDEDKDQNLGHPYRCPAANQTDISSWQQVIRNIGYVLGVGERPEVRCVPFDTISSAHVLFEAPKPATFDDDQDSGTFSGRTWRSEFAGRVVMYGFNLQGFQDVIQPPTIDAGVAGVYLHAMALENLLTNGWGYLSDQAIVRWPVFGKFGLDIDSIEIVTLILVFGFRLTVMWIMRKYWPSPMTKSRTIKFFGLGSFWRHKFNAEKNVIWNIPANLGKAKYRKPLWRTSFVLFLLLLDAVIVCGIVVSSAFWLEYSYLALAPANWLGILGLAFVTYPVFVASLFRGSEHEEGDEKAS